MVRNYRFHWLNTLWQMCWMNRVYGLTVILLVLCLGGIIILHLTNWRLFPDLWENGKCINYIIETICFSVLAACLFFFVNDMIPKIPIWSISRFNIQSNIRNIKESLRIMVELVEPFSFSATRYTKREFIDIFSSMNLNEGAWSLQYIIEDKRDNIEKICEKLIGSYLFCMTYGEIRYIEYIMGSFFLQNKLKAIDFSIPDESRVFYSNNQAAIGESIIDLYLLTAPKEYKLLRASWQVLESQEDND